MSKSTKRLNGQKCIRNIVFDSISHWMNSVGLIILSGINMNGIEKYSRKCWRKEYLRLHAIVMFYEGLKLFSGKSQSIHFILPCILYIVKLILAIINELLFVCLYTFWSENLEYTTFIPPKKNRIANGSRDHVQKKYSQNNVNVVKSLIIAITK